MFMSRDYQLIMYIGAGTGLISFLGVWFFLEESALFWLRIGQVIKAEGIIKRIYKTNGEGKSNN